MPRLRKETNIPNSKINRFVLEKNENNSDDMDEVCNFSGINNISCSNGDEFEYKNRLFDNYVDDDFQKAHSPKIIFRKKINFNKNQNIINKPKENNIIIIIIYFWLINIYFVFYLLYNFLI